MTEKHAGGMKFIGGPLDGKEYTREVTASVIRILTFGGRRPMIIGGDVFGRDLMTDEGLDRFNESGTPPIDFVEYSVVDGSLVHKLTKRFYKPEAYADQVVVS